MYALYSNRGSTVNSWIVECDVINRFVSNGLIGGFMFYFWLVNIARRGKRISYKYVVLIISLIIEGVTYEVLTDWVIAVLLIMDIAIKHNINFFELKLQTKIPFKIK